MRIITTKQIGKIIDMSEYSDLPPLFFGNAGVGKTQIVIDYAKEKNYNIETIEVSLLSEGELALPYPSQDKYGSKFVAFQPHQAISRVNRNYREWMDYQNGIFAPLEIKDLEEAGTERLMQVAKEYEVSPENKTRDELILELSQTPYPNYKSYRYDDLIAMKDKDLEKQYLINFGKNIPETNSKYTTVVELYEKQPKERTVLFVDELTRSSIETGSQLMNLILNKAVNGIEMVPNTIVVAAANPITEIEGVNAEVYHGSGFFDGAKISRFSTYFVDTNFKGWLENFAYAQDDKYGRQMIHPTIIEFISEAPESRLMVLNDDDTGEASARTNPRTWKAASDKLYYLENIYKDDRDAYNDEIVSEFASVLDKMTAIELSKFVRHNSNPLPHVEDIFDNPNRNDLNDKILDYLDKEINGVRKGILGANMVNYLAELDRPNTKWNNVLVEYLKALDLDVAMFPIIRVLILGGKGDNNKHIPTANQKKFYNHLKENNIEFFELYNSIRRAAQLPDRQK